MVDMENLIWVHLVEPDGSEVEQQMTEGAARDLLHELGIPTPPVLCEAHERMPISTEASHA